MKQINLLPYLGRLFLFLMVTILLPTMVLAESSAWQWQTTLRVEEPAGDYMYMPSAVAFDPESERYYVVDTGRNRLVSFGRDGKMLKAFTANEQLKAPFDMVRLDNGQLWVVEKGRNSLTRIDIGAKEVKSFVLKDGKRQIFPDRIAYAGGSLYVLDRASGDVLRLDDELSVAQRYGCADCLGGLVDFVIVEGTVWGLEPRSKKVFRYDPDGSIAETISLGNEADFPISLAVEPSGYIYILDRHQNSILTYSSNGRFGFRFLGTGQAHGKVHFARQLRFDPWGQLCVVDEGNGRVEIFSR